MFKELPPLFDDFTILHLSDMHVDMNEAAMQRLIELVSDICYDLCVLTGDYRGEPPRDCRRPFGLSYAAMAGCSSMA
jgi:predicted MPP superfamily phosphohydrolase